MKGIKDFLIMYFLCVIVLLIAATVLSGVKGGFWSLLLFGAFLVTLLFYAAFRLLCRIDELERRLAQLTGVREDGEKE